MEITRGGATIFQSFMNYFGMDNGFLGCLLMYFPFCVILFSLLVTIFTRKLVIAPIVVFLVFGSFFGYAYSQFNAAISNFIIPLIGYIIISFVIGVVVNKVKSRFSKS